MKFYIAARFSKRSEVGELYKLLKEKGHQISSDWTGHKSVKPFSENQEIAKQYSIEDINGVKNCDVFILLTDEAGGKGAHVELGAAISSNVDSNKPLIYVIGKYADRSMFYFHPSVNRKKTIAEVLEELEKR